MIEKYYVVTQDGDGDWSLTEYTSLEDVIEDYGLDDDPEYNEDCHPAYDFKKEISDYESGSVLIKGRIMLPKTKEVVKSWEFVEVEND